MHDILTMYDYELRAGYFRLEMDYKLLYFKCNNYFNDFIKVVWLIAFDYFLKCLMNVFNSILKSYSRTLHWLMSAFLIIIISF